MANSSFDIVSEVDIQEVSNAVEQTKQEIQNRYDFKNVKREVTFDKSVPAIRLEAEDEMTLNKVIDVLLTKMIKRSIPTKSMIYGKTEPTGKIVKKEVTIQQGISKENCKKVLQLIKKTNLKVQAQIMDEQIRVSSKSRDNLQSVMQEIKSQEFDFDVQFINYR